VSAAHPKHLLEIFPSSNPLIDQASGLRAPLGFIWIIDLMGHLAEIYGLADVAIVGGGFDGNLHNCLEPAAQGIPVLFGSKHSRAPEAATLLEAQAAKTFEEPDAMFQFLKQCASVPVPTAGSSHGQDECQSVLARMALNASKLFESIPQTNEIVRTYLAAKEQSQTPS
jgi:3-deoxy-D-manno-octulosonic-acid transferase